MLLLDLLGEDGLLLLLRVEGVAGRGKGGRVLLLERREQHGRLAHPYTLLGRVRRHWVAMIPGCLSTTSERACGRPAMLRRAGGSPDRHQTYQDGMGRERQASSSFWAAQRLQSTLLLCILL